MSESQDNQLTAQNLLSQISTSKAFGGRVVKYSHQSTTLSCEAKVSVFLPPKVRDVDTNDKVPALVFLSGLTCNEDNFITKAGALRKAAEENIILVCPDTSPRGDDVPDVEGWDHGKGAGFYVNATQEPFKKNYHMYDYVNVELMSLILAQLPCDGNVSIFGHSMGGHGALISALRNPGMYKSVSAFAPICNPINVPWGKKNFGGYLGPDEETWKEYDATELVKTYQGPPLEILIDQGWADKFYDDGQLCPEAFQDASINARNAAVLLRFKDDYDHGYNFIATFVEEHIAHHARFLKEKKE